MAGRQTIPLDGTGAAPAHATKVGLARESAELLAEIAAEVARRQQDGQDKAPPIYMLVYNLGRFRDLRKEDEFSFGGSDEGQVVQLWKKSSRPFCGKARPWASTR